MIIYTKKHPISSIFQRASPRCPPLFKCQTLLVFTFLHLTILLFSQADKPIPVETLYNQARTFAADQRLDTAIVLMKQACTAQEQDMDMRLYLARLYAWKKDFENAQYNNFIVLEKQPRNQDALLVLADIYLWSKQWDRLEKHTKYVFELISKHEMPLQVYDSIPFIQKYAYGLIEQNRYADAEKLLYPVRDRLFSLWDMVKLKLIVNALSVHYAFYNFKTQQTDWQVTELDYSRQFRKISFIGSLNYAQRFDKTGLQWMAQAYPKIGNRAYAWLLLGVSDGKTYPDWVYGGSFFTHIKKYWEVEAGIRFFKVKNNEKAAILRGGLVYHYKQSRLAYNISQVRGTGATGLTHSLSYQNYFKKDESFVRIGIGTGSSADVLLTPQYDSFLINSLSINATINYKFNRHWALSVGSSWERNENKLDKNAQSRWIFDTRLVYKF